MTAFNLSTLVTKIAEVLPRHEVLVWRDRRLTYEELDQRATGLARFLVSSGLGARRERLSGEGAGLLGHESGQDHVGIYLRNGNEYLESLVGTMRARTAPFNINYRYVHDELVQVLRDAGTAALIYAEEFAPQVAAIRHRLPDLRVLVQVADGTGHVLLDGAVDYRDALAAPSPVGGLPDPSPHDLLILFTGGTTGVPKGVLWRQDDIYVAAMGGTPFGGTEPFSSWDALTASAAQIAAESPRAILVLAPLMHAAAQWAVFHMITCGGKVVFPDDVERLDPANALEIAQRERVMMIPTIGDAVALPLVEEMERAMAQGRPYDLSGVAAINNGSAPLSTGVRSRILQELPHAIVMDSAGSSETGIQMTSMSFSGTEADAATFKPAPTVVILDDRMEQCLAPGDGEGWLAQTGRLPLGYLDDADKTARAFPTVNGIRYAVSGDRAEYLADGQIRLLGRDNATINSGGEKIFAEEVERALLAHPAVRDAVVVGRPSPRWGSEVVGIVAIMPGVEVSDEDVISGCESSIARYKLPKVLIRTEEIFRSPVGKADYRWAAEVAVKGIDPRGNPDEAPGL